MLIFHADYEYEIRVWLSLASSILIISILIKTASAPLAGFSGTNFGKI
jgi:hypothetical protein